MNIFDDKVFQEHDDTFILDGAKITQYRNMHTFYTLPAVYDIAI